MRYGPPRLPRPEEFASTRDERAWDRPVVTITIMCRRSSWVRRRRRMGKPGWNDPAAD